MECPGVHICPYQPKGNTISAPPQIEKSYLTIQHKCEWCGKKFFSKTRKKYCSDECRYQANKLLTSLKKSNKND